MFKSDLIVHLLQSKKSIDNQKHRPQSNKCLKKKIENTLCNGQNKGEIYKSTHSLRPWTRGEGFEGVGAW